MEEIRKELEKPKRESILRGGLFLRRKQNKNTVEPAVQKKKTGIDPDVSVTASGAEDADVKQEEAVKEEAAVIRDTAQMERSVSMKSLSARQRIILSRLFRRMMRKRTRRQGRVNPYTGREYQSNSVRMHPTRIGYVQVYDRTIHKGQI